MAGETILVVDDGQENREFLRKHILEPEGYNILMARDGQEGLDMAIAHRPDLILLDLNMPRMGGIKVLESMHAQALDIPVVLMTFYGSEEIAIHVFRLGARDYVQKPYSVEDMMNVIERNLTETRLRREKQALTDRLIHSNTELQHRVRELNILYSVGKSVTSLIDIDHLLPRLVDAAVQITEAEEGAIYLLENGKLVCHAQKRHNAPRAITTKIETEDAAIFRTIKTRQPFVMTETDRSRRRNGLPWSAAYAPLLLKDRVIGVLSVQNISRDVQAFTNHHAALLSALTDYAAIAIENARNYDVLRAQKDRETEHVRNTFERFVPPSIVDKALNEPQSLQLGGERQEISVVFADIRGYSTWSENIEPEKVIETLNHYLSLAAEVVLAWEGTLDKYVGDGFMAIFNAPERQDNHIHRAADAALALIKAAEEVQSMHGHRLAYSIGVHVGEAVVGYIGTDRAINYTAIGDTVNLAKRLQESAQPNQILVSEAIVTRLNGLAKANPLGELKVKGRKQRARAYELTGLAYDSTPIDGTR